MYIGAISTCHICAPPANIVTTARLTRPARARAHASSYGSLDLPAKPTTRP